MLHELGRLTDGRILSSLAWNINSVWADISTRQLFHYVLTHRFSKTDSAMFATFTTTCVWTHFGEFSSSDAVRWQLVSSMTIPVMVDLNSIRSTKDIKANEMVYQQWLADIKMTKLGFTVFACFTSCSRMTLFSDSCCAFFDHQGCKKKH